MMQYNTIAELQNYIVLDNYVKSSIACEPPAGYQTEAALERELIDDLKNQGYEYVPEITSPDALLTNARKQLQTLNQVVFTDAEWTRFVDEYLDKPNDSLVEKAKKVHENHIYDFVFDDGHIQNIYLVDKTNITRNKVQVINQFEQTGTQANRPFSATTYFFLDTHDVTAINKHKAKMILFICVKKLFICNIIKIYRSNYHFTTNLKIILQL